MFIHEYIRSNEVHPDFIVSIVSRGLSVPGAKKLEPKYYSELSGWTITHMGQTFIRSLVPSECKKIKALQDKELHEQQISEHVETLLKKSLHFFSPAELIHFEICVIDKQIHTYTTFFSKWCGALESGACSEEMRFEEFIQKNDLTAANAMLTAVPTGDYMYVFTYTRKFYIFKERRAEIQHISITRGEAVLGAGEMRIEGGKIVKINNLSGHYRPTRVQLINVLEYLTSCGVDINSCSTICRDTETPRESQYLTPLKENHGEICEGRMNPRI